MRFLKNEGSITLMQTAKKEVEKILQHLSDNATFEDIQYHIYVREKIEKGLQDVQKGRTLTQEEVEKRMSRWLDR